MSGVTQTAQNERFVSVTSQQQGLVVSQLSDAILQRTVVEAFVKMVVCRKVTIQKISARDGQVLDTSTRQEEDKPVILEVNRHETTDKLLAESDVPVRECSSDIHFTSGSFSVRDGGDQIYIERDQHPPDRSVNFDSHNNSSTPHRMRLPQQQFSVSHTQRLGPPSGSNILKQNYPDIQSRIPVQTSVLRQRSQQMRQQEQRAVPTGLVQNYQAQTLANIKVEPADCILVDDECLNVPASSQIAYTGVGGCPEYPVDKHCSFNKLDRKDVHVWRQSHSALSSDFHQKSDTNLLNTPSTDSELDDSGCKNRSLACTPETRKDLRQTYVRNLDREMGDPECKITDSLLCSNVEKRSPQTNTELSQPFSCDLCHKKYRTRATLQVHIRTHTGDKPFHCPHCPKQFAQSCVLRCHLRIHTGEKPYICNICSKAFAQKGHLTAHYQFHSGIRPFKCLVCEKKFFQKSDLRKHQRKHKQ